VVSVTLAAFPEPGDAVNKSNMAQDKDVLALIVEDLVEQESLHDSGFFVIRRNASISVLEGRNDDSWQAT
jgi:hypothetical protein